MNPCYCGNNKSFTECCDLYLSKGHSAGSPEVLMRSRYSAFCIKDMDYIEKTTHPKTRGDFNRQENQEWAAASVFYRLEILSRSTVGQRGVVTFKAYSRINDQENVHHEISNFQCEKGIWFFLDGIAAKSGMEN